MRRDVGTEEVKKPPPKIFLKNLVSAIDNVDKMCYNILDLKKSARHSEVGRKRKMENKITSISRARYMVRHGSFANDNTVVKFDPQLLYQLGMTVDRVNRIYDALTLRKFERVSKREADGIISAERARRKSNRPFSGYTNINMYQVIGYGHDGRIQIGDRDDHYGMALEIYAPEVVTASSEKGATRI